MDLLDSVLRAANAEKYTNNFREANIDAQCLKILVEKDLEMLGVEEPELRTKLLARIKNLVIHAEKRVEINVDEDYAQIVLLNISNHFVQHQANLICAAERRDIINCDVKLEKATDSLKMTIEGFNRELEKLKKNLKNSKKRPKNKTKIVVLSTTIVGLAACFGYMLMKNLNLQFNNVKL